ncbi:MAG: hypothetical protein QOF89_6228 [Acidobacteriota bacterium]|nr:hypothetical protein [Acidobacteriota bacterium]
MAYPGPIMKIAKAVLYAIVILGAVVAFGWFFVSQLGSGGRTDGLAGVMLSPPPGYSIVERGELAPTAAAAELESQTALSSSGKVGIRFQRQGATVYWLADVPGDLLEERAAGSSGTRLQTTWHGSLRERLSWARDHGDFSAPGLPPPERKNLYH